jgi:hypothetical protein
VAQLAHCARFDLTNALTSEVEVFTNFFKGATFAAATKAEAQTQDFAFTFVEWC